MTSFELDGFNVYHIKAGRYDDKLKAIKRGSNRKVRNNAIKCTIYNIFENFQCKFIINNYLLRFMSALYKQTYINDVIFCE